jgi:hypothetical protein
MILCCLKADSTVGALHRHFFLDAALLMRDHPQEHLLLVWAEILQQQDDSGLRQPTTLAHWRHEAEELWTVCASATLVGRCSPRFERMGLEKEDVAYYR